MPRKTRGRRKDDRPLVHGEIRRADRDALARLEAGRVLRRLRRVPCLAPAQAAMLFERYLDLAKPEHRVTVFDPCCGTGVSIATLQVEYGRFVEALHAADADPKAIRITRTNLAVLNDGAAMAARIGELVERRARTQRPRLDGVIEDARTLGARSHDGRPPVHITQADALLDPLPVDTVDLVLTDPPYDRRSRWLGSDLEDEVGIRIFLERTRTILSSAGRIALVLDPAVELPEVDGLAIEDRIALDRRAGWILAQTT